MIKLRFILAAMVALGLLAAAGLSNAAQAQSSKEHKLALYLALLTMQPMSESAQTRQASSPARSDASARRPLLFGLDTRGHPGGKALFTKQGAPNETPVGRLIPIDVEHFHDG